MLSLKAYTTKIYYISILHLEKNSVINSSSEFFIFFKISLILTGVFIFILNFLIMGFFSLLNLGHSHKIWLAFLISPQEHRSLSVILNLNRLLFRELWPLRNLLIDNSFPVQIAIETTDYSIANDKAKKILCLYLKLALCKTRNLRYLCYIWI